VNGPSERAVANFIVREGPRAAAMSAKEIAAEVGTSDATVVRTAKSLGYGSLRDLRRALVGRAAPADLSHRLQATLDSTTTTDDVLASAVQGQLSALDTLLRRVSRSEFDAAAALLAASEQVWWSGIGPSEFMAGYGAFLCRRLGTPAGLLTRAGTDHADELLGLQAGHAVVILAYGRIHPSVAVTLERVTDIGARCVLVTDTPRHRLSRAPDIVLDAGRGAPEFFATHGPTVVLVEALVLAIAARDPRRSTDALSTLNGLRRSLAGRRIDVDPA
jgi:DNA-binding MurR/RpiR family transcriptional regulator